MPEQNLRRISLLALASLSILHMANQLPSHDTALDFGYIECQSTQQGDINFYYMEKSPTQLSSLCLSFICTFVRKQMPHHNGLNRTNA